MKTMFLGLLLFTASNLSTIAGGLGNIIDQGSDFGAIAGRCINLIGQGTNTGSCYSAILGGCMNCIQEGFWNSILGGRGNIIANGIPYAPVFGSNVTALESCSLHANTFTAQAMCDRSTGAPLPTAGTFYYCIIGGEKHVIYCII